MVGVFLVCHEYNLKVFGIIRDLLETGLLRVKFVSLNFCVLYIVFKERLKVLFVYLMSIVF